MTADADPPPTLELKDQLSIELMDQAAFPDQVLRALAMNKQTIAAANSFHSLFCERHKDGKAADDHYEQDLLRAMLLFSCSGLDAVVKQLVRDGLPSVISRDQGAQSQFSKYIERRLKRGAGDDVTRGQFAQPTLDFSLLSDVLASPLPREVLIGSLTRSLTDDSLQSRDQLLRVAGHFALTSDDVLAATGDTKDAFDARNQLAHEMDIDFRFEDRRRDRAYADMVRWSENILQIGRTFIRRVSDKIGTAS